MSGAAVSVAGTALSVSSSTAYTVFQTCKANGVDPQAYIADVIVKVANNWPASRWDELMPWNWSREPARLAA
ncbi:MULTISPECIES: transposase domain-containing protein [Sphingomonas]|jgi:transposase|uniref:Transposase IS66 C-terminal domain-containing protein n=1 Tax=Sphingomonas turrisvirgatae TaxID=1888892 RepID=A0A1E3LYR2_9SPHN|nr:hypothetical protein BFL28_12600 [Sphingomonas turrisvirgatae]